MSIRRIFLQTSRTIIEFLQQFSSPSVACFLQNLAQFLINAPTRFSFDKKLQLYVAAHNGKCRYFPDFKRGFRLYTFGIATRARTLAESYHIDQIKFDRDDVIVDCGANYGDLFTFLEEKLKQQNYYAVEPSPKEMRCLRLNYPNAVHCEVALSDRNGTSKFFLNTRQADSSLVEPHYYSETITVETCRLDDLPSLEHIKKIKLLKIEAEGFEPEILKGAIKTIQKTKYIAVDGGFERGTDKSETYTSAVNFLVSRNFELVSTNFQSLKALFKKV